MEDPNTIVEWFRLVEKTIAQYGITSDDIYNFDESGFAMGVSATTKIII
jgi:RecB family endonuclease NucS